MKSRTRFAAGVLILILAGLAVRLPWRKAVDVPTIKSFSPLEEPADELFAGKSVHPAAETPEVPSSENSNSPSSAPPQRSAAIESPIKQASAPAGDFGAWTAEKLPPPDMAKIEAFGNWSEIWMAASPEERMAMKPEGVRLATERRKEFKSLIASEPRVALEKSVSRVVRQDLPREIVAELEEPVSATGNYQVYRGRPAPGQSMPQDGLTLRYFEPADGTSYIARVFGEMDTVMSRKQIPLRGVALDREFAVAESPVRQLEIGERVAAGTTVEDICPVSGETTEVVAGNEPVTEETPTVEIGERVITLCNGAHVSVLDEKYRTLIQASGPGGSAFFMDNFPGTSATAIGNLRCLYIRLTYPDQMAAPNTEDEAKVDMDNVARFYQESSYGKLTATTTITPLIVLPHSLAWYVAKDYEVDGLGLIQSHARAEARKLGYDSTRFNCIIVRVSDGLRGGASWGGSDSVWAGWGGMDVLNHECGHSLGLNHANFWNTSDGTAYGNGSNEEYGNPFDVMGGGGGFVAHYNVISKRALGWLPDSYLHQPRVNGIYRITAYDQPRLEEGKRYALSVAKDSVRSYHLEYHPAAGGTLTDSALVLYSGMGSNAGHLLDTTPGSSPGKGDAGIQIGRTFSDLEADMHFTVVGKNATEPPSLDVAYHRGPFIGNLPPTVTLTANNLSPAVGGSVTFTATATDPNGDDLAYFWDFNDGVTGTNSAVFTRTFSVAAQVTAMLTVSDMRGGVTRRFVVINAGSHGRQSVTGNVSWNGQPLDGVRITSGSNYCHTDSNGNYALTGLSTGAQTLSANLNGYNFTPSFTNPLTVATGTNTANWTAGNSTFVTLTKTADATEGGASGSFTFTRTGDTSAALTVLVSPAGGTAIKSTDYTFSPDHVTSGSFRSFTIAAGQASRVVTVGTFGAFNDTAQEGPETITLQLASNGSYISNSANSVVMTIFDNDTTLPQVAVSATDPYARESPADPGVFTFTRTGATGSALNIAVTWTGAATNGTDYATLPSTVVIPTGQSSVQVIVNPLDDSLIEGPEDCVANISNNGAYVRNTAATTAAVNITDDDVPVVSVIVADAKASESGNDTGLLLISRTGSTAAPLKVYFGLSGTASHGTDYAALNGEVIIPAGAVSAPVVIKAYDDELGEAKFETVVLSIATFNNLYSVGSAPTGTVTIEDNNDPPVVSVRAGGSGVEGGTNPTLIFRAIGSAGGTVTVNYALSGTATPGVDYSAPGGSVVIPANGSSEITVSLPVTDDALPEPTETITARITPSPSYRTYNDVTAQVSVFDNDSGDRVMVSTFNGSPTEAGTSSTYYISRTGTSGSLTVNYTMSGTATNGADYATLFGEITIPDGQSGVNLTISPINDTSIEGTETITLNLLSGTGYGVDIPSSATFELQDNETAPITVGFQSASQLTSELPGADGAYRDIPVVLSAASGSAVSVRYTSAGGSATGDDVDWTYVDPDDGNAVISGGTLVFPPGTTTKNLRIKVKNDGMLEGSESAVLELRSPSLSGLTGGMNRHTVIIYDDVIPPHVLEERWSGNAVFDNQTWSGSAPSYSGYLNSFVTPQNIGDNYSRRLTGQIIAPVTGDYTFWIASDDASRLYLSTTQSAANKVVIASLANSTNFQSWDEYSSQTSATITLQAGQSYYMEVQHAEGSGQDHASVAWAGPGIPRQAIPAPSIETGPLRGIRFAVANTIRFERDVSEPMLMAILDRPVTNTPVTVDYTVAGTATPGSDFLLNPGTLTFAVGEQVKLLPLTLLTDALGEAPETIIVSLTNPTNGIISSPASHTVTIVDDNAPQIDTKYFTANSTMSSGTVLGSATGTPSPGRALTSWAIVSGNTGNALAISAAGQLSVQIPAALPNPGLVQLIVRATDNLGATGDGVLNVLTNSAQSVAWINPAGGSWPVTDNWFNGTVAGGVGVVPDFGVLDLMDDATVTLDGPTTVGGLVFGDTSPSHNWTIETGSAGPLTLGVSSGVPLVNVRNQTATIAAELTGNKGLTKTGAGTLRITGSGSWTGPTTVSAGTLDVRARNGNIGYTVAQGASLVIGYNTGGGYTPGITINGNGASNAAGLYLVGGRTIETNDGLLMQTQPTTIRTDGSGTANLQGFDVNSAYFLRTAATASGSFVETEINFQTGNYGYKIQTDSGSRTASGDLTIKGAIVGGGGAQVDGEALSSGLHKWGTGSLRLAGSSTFTQATAINQGSLILSGGDNRLPVGTTVVVGNGGNSGSLVLEGISQTVAGLQANGSGSSNSVVGGSTTLATLEIANATALNFTGRLGGTGARANNLILRKSGPAVLTLSAANTYTGETLITAGTLTLASTGSLASPTITVESGALFNVAAVTGGYSLGTSRTLSVRGAVTGHVTIASGATLTIGGTTGATATGTITGNLTLAGTTSLRIHKTGAVLTNDVLSGISTLTQGGTLLVTASGDPLVLGDSFTLFSATTFAGGFSTRTLPSLSSGLIWNTSQLATTGTITVANGIQTITFGAISSKVYGGSAFNLTATASSGLPVIYTSSNPLVATISGNTVTLVGAGSAIITASQPGDANYLPANSIARTLTVNKANQTITFGVIAPKVFGSAAFNLNATSSSNLAVTYTSSNPLVATVSGNTVTIVGTGSTTITASQPGDANHLVATSVNQSLTVTQATQTVTFGAISSRVFGGSDFNLSATASSGLPVTYTSSNPLVATISGNTVTLVGAGSATITASQPGDANYLAANSIARTLTVNKANQTITFGAIAPEVYGSAAFNLDATSNSTLAVTYTSSDPLVATISGNTVTLVGAGSATITASQPGDANYLVATSVSQPLTVSKAVATVSFDGLAQDCDGFAKPVTPTTNPSGLTVVTTYDGSLTAPSAVGSYTVVATIDDSNYSGSATATLVISSNSLVVEFSETLQLPDATTTYQSLLNDGTLIFRAGTLHITGDANNHGILRLYGNAVLDVSGTFTNTGVIDIINWSGTMPPGLINSGTILDRSAIRVISTQASSTHFTLSVPDFAGHLYQLESTTDLGAAWAPVGSAVPGTGPAVNPPALLFTPPLDGPRRFYRVVVSPAP